MPWDWWLSPWALGVLGLCVGSFLNVVVYRTPRILVRQWSREAAEILTSHEEVASTQAVSATEAKDLAKRAQALLDGLDRQPPYSLARPRSACPSCGHALAWHENLPLLGWLRLAGRCSACGTRISARYPLVELSTGLLFAAVGWHMGAHPVALLWCGFVALLLAASLVDWDTTLLPDTFTLNLLWAGLVAAGLGWTLPLTDALWGVVGAAVGLGGISKGWKWLRGFEGMAMGDVKLLAALGAWLGWQMLLPIVLLASAVGAIVGIGMKLSGALREGRYVPFGPFLAGAALVVMFAGQNRVLHWLGWA